MRWPTLFVHSKGTTGHDGAARRRHAYAESCEQCGRGLEPTTRVAAHVVAYACPCVNCCCGVATLRTTCKACNATRRRSAFFRAWPSRGVRLRRVCVPWCAVHDDGGR